MKLIFALLFVFGAVLATAQTFNYTTQEKPGYTVLCTVVPGSALFHIGPSEVTPDSIEVWVLPKATLDPAVNRIEVTVVVDYIGGPTGAKLVARGQINPGQAGIAIVQVPTVKLRLRGASRVVFYRVETTDELEILP